MGRAGSSAFVVKRLLANLRLPRCQPVHREAVVAAPSNTSATFPKKTAAEESQAWLASNTCSHRPEAINLQGSHLYQNQLVSCFSTQSQLTWRKGPDISLLDIALQKDWDHARNAHLGNSVIRPTVIGWSGGAVKSVQTGTCTAGQQPSTAGAVALGVHSAAATKCASTTPWLPGLQR
ncbi:hypothetical protein ABBQ38_008289 [Trebouxia sp. C0009 RCD-2024]